MAAKKKNTKKSKKSKKKSHHFLPWMLVLLTLFGLGYWGYSYLKKPVYQPIRAIPNDAALVFETVQLKDFWDALNYDNALWSGLKESQKMADWCQKVHRLDSLLLLDDEFWDITEDHPFYWSLHVEKNQPKSLYVIGLDNAHQENEANDFVKKCCSQQAKIEKKSLGDFPYYSVTDGDITFCYSVSYGIFIASESLSLLEKSLRQLAFDEGLSAQNDFQEIKATCGKKVDANVFVATQKLPFFSQKFAHNAPFSLLKNWESLSLWNGLDLYVKSNAWLLNGYTSIADEQLLMLFQAQQSVENQGIYLLPKETTAWIQLGFSDPTLFFDNLLKYQSKTTVLQAINEKYHLSLIDDFKSFASQEIYFAWIKTAPMLMLHLSDIERATSTMLRLSDKTIDYHAGNIVKLNSSEFCHAVFGENIFSFRPAHWCIFGEYLLLAETSSMIQEVIASTTNVTQTPQYQAMTESLVDYSNFSLCCLFSDANAFLRRNCSKALYQNWLKNKSIVQNFNGISLQFSTASGLFYTSALASFHAADFVPTKKETQKMPENPTPTTEEEGSKIAEVVDNEEETNIEPVVETPAKTLVEPIVEPISGTTISVDRKSVKLEGKMVLQPFFVFDHTTKEQKIVVFDERSNMYLIDNQGKIIWTKRLHEVPMSEVYQVDFYANGKIQYLFNSKNWLYMIDLKGNWVSGYPMKLKEAAQNPIAVFDYQKNRDYRIVFVDAKGLIHNCSKEGNSVSGWKNPRLEDAITSPAQCCLTAEGTRLIFPMDNGQVLLTQQDGTMWMKIEQSFVNSTHSDFYLNRTNSKGTLLTTDSKGTLVYIPEKGAVKTTSFGTFSNKHHFVYQDFNGDGSHDFIYLDGKKLTIFDRLQNVLLTYSFPTAIATTPKIYCVDNQCFLAVFAPAEQKTYLFTKNGLRTTIEGTTPVNILPQKKGKPSIVVGNGSLVDFYEL